MKKLLFIFTILLSLASCKKEEFEPMTQVPDEAYADTTDWRDQYSNGGTLPTSGANNGNDLVGTTWVLTKMVSSFATEYPNDTIVFTSNTKYTVNNSAVRTYQLSSLPNSTNYDLSFNYFYPFGGSHYGGQVGFYFVSDGEINNVEFEDTQNSSTTIRAWFTKI